MNNNTMEMILSILTYGYQIIAILIIASIIPALVFMKWKRKKLFAILLLLCLSLELFSLHYLAYNPIWICPKAYREYVSEEEKRSLIAASSGVYNKYIPVVPVCIFVKYADEDSVKVTTFYFAFGDREVEIGSDGLPSGGKLWS